MNKRYYVVVSRYGFISTGSEYAQPHLVICGSLEECNLVIQEMDLRNGDINKRAWRISAKEAYKNYKNYSVWAEEEFKNAETSEEFFEGYNWNAHKWEFYRG